MCSMYLDQDAHELSTVLFWIYFREVSLVQLSHILLQFTDCRRKIYTRFINLNDYLQARK